MTRTPNVTGLPLGVMQGRLSPKVEGRYQSHPQAHWRGEFALAATLGLRCIEFIVDTPSLGNNPMLRSGGADEVRAVVEESGVRVLSLCADCFMDLPLHDATPARRAQAWELLGRLLESSARVGVADIVIPCVDASSLAVAASSLSVAAGAPARLVEVLRQAAPLARALGIRLALETDLGPRDFAALLAGLPAEITVNYDIGNSAALGFAPAEELAAYGDRLSSVHVKDRLLGGGSLALGTGAADFAAFFAALAATEFRGPFIMQAYRDDEGLAVFKRQLEWFAPMLRGWLQEQGERS